MQVFQYAGAEDISRNSRENNRRDGDGGVAAEFLRYAHADRCGNGFGEQGDVGNVVKLEEQRENEYGNQSGQHAGKDSEKYGGHIVF